MSEFPAHGNEVELSIRSNARFSDTDRALELQILRMVANGADNCIVTAGYEKIFFFLPSFRQA